VAVAFYPGFNGRIAGQPDRLPLNIMPLPRIVACGNDSEILTQYELNEWPNRIAFQLGTFIP